MGNCSQVNNTTIIGTSTITYDGTPLPCTDVNTCDGLNTILSKFDAIICDVKDSVDILTEEITNITESVMIIGEDIINIYNQLEICCPTCDFTGTADQVLNCDFTGTANQIPDTTTTTTSTSSSTTTTTTTLLDCSFTGTANEIPVSTTTTTSSSTSTSTSSTSTTTSTTTAAPAIGCIEVTNATFSGGTSECDGTPYPITLGNVTVELLDNLGNPVIATEDITITLAFESKQCGDTIPIPINVPVTILTGTSLITFPYTEQIVNDCGVNDCQTLTEFFQSVVSISPSSYSLCPETTTTTTTIACASYTVATTAAQAQLFTYTDCEGNPQSGYVGGVGGFDSQTFCAQLNSVVGTGETTTTYNGPCTTP